MPPPISIRERIQPLKISPLGLVSAGMAKVRNMSSVAGSEWLIVKALFYWRRLFKGRSAWSLTEVLVSVATDQMIIDHAGGLHKGITNRWANKAKTIFLHLPAHVL